MLILIKHQQVYLFICNNSRSVFHSENDIFLIDNTLRNRHSRLINLVLYQNRRGRRASSGARKRLLGVKTNACVEGGFSLPRREKRNNEKAIFEQKYTSRQR